MKAMNYLLTIVLLFMVGSCSKETPIENEDFTTVQYRSRPNQKESKKNQEVFELDLHQYHVLGQLKKLEELRILLEIEIEEGNEEQIPIWESVMEQIQSNTDILTVILENSCSYLKLRLQILQLEVISGNEGSREELEEVREKVRQCETDEALQGLFITETIISPIIDGEHGRGGCQDPGQEWSCKHLLAKGTLLINTIDDQEEVYQVQLQTLSGETIHEGEYIGNHHELEGVNQIAIEVNDIESGALVVNKAGVEYASEVEIR